MPSDCIMLSALCKELSAALVGGRIEKIYQPEADELTISVKTSGGTRTLAVSANASLPRVHISARKKENPLTAPPFCMLLRKHLGGGALSDISLINDDRIIQISISVRNELGDKTVFFLIAELTGRLANIILADKDFKVLDAVKRIPLDKSSRPIFPGMAYAPPQDARIRLSDAAAVSAYFAENKRAEKEVPAAIGGISKESVREICLAPSPAERLNLLMNAYGTPLFKPCLLVARGGGYKDYYITPYGSVDGAYEFFASMNEALDAFYSEKDADGRKTGHTAELTSLLNRLQKRVSRRIDDHTEKLKESEESEIYRVYGELITNNLHRLKTGDEKLVCENYYADNAAVTIPLDAALAPNANAQAYFKKYGKLKRAKQFSELQLEKLFLQREHLLAIKAAIESSDTKQEYREILEELREIDGKKEGGKKPRQKPSSPLRIVFEGTEIYVGKNSVQNNQVSFQLAEPNDTWLHAKGYHGAHVIIKSSAPSGSVLTRAAELCAYYSQTRSSDKAAIDYTLKKYVKRHKNGIPGMAVYTEYKTILVKPSP